jgi:hypothetical protein
MNDFDDVLERDKQKPPDYPLCWPNGWPRVPASERKRARYEVTRAAALEDLFESLRLMQCIDVVVSLNVKFKAGVSLSNAPEPADPGVAVYWTRKGKSGCMACDKYLTLRDNIRAIGSALEGIRQVERSGASEVLEKVFTGLKALPAHITPARGWREVLGFSQLHPGELPTRKQVDDAYRTLSRSRHPDHGGSQEQFVELTTAREDALREIDWKARL